MRTLADVIAFNQEHAAREMPWFGQSLFEKAEETEESRRRPTWSPSTRVPPSGSPSSTGRSASTTWTPWSRPATAPATPIDLVNGDPGGRGGASDSSALAGSPILTVPLELAHGLPVALSLWGARGSETRLLRLGRALEAGRDARTGPLPAPTFPEWV